MAEPNWELWEQVLRDIQARLVRVESKLVEHDKRFDQLDAEVKGFKRMSQMALGAASGADFVAERAEKLATETNKRPDALIAALHEKDIHVDA